jgi:hypothetical protein
MTNHTNQQQREAAFINEALMIHSILKTKERSALLERLTTTHAEREFKMMFSTVKPGERAAVLKGFTAQLSTRMFGEHPAA